MSARPLRIAQVAPLWAGIPPATYGGIELVVHLLIEELVRRGHEVTLFATGESRTSAKLRVITSDTLFNMMESGRASLYDYYINAAMSEALRNRGEFDVVHVHAGMSLVPFAPLSATPCVFTMHTYFSNDEEWILGQYPDVPVVGISRGQMRHLTASRGHETPVVYNGIDFATFRPRFERGEYLAFLGRLSHDKNPLDAIKIAQEVGMPIVLAGRPQSRKEELYFAQHIEPLIDGKGVRWIGPVDHEQKNELLRNAAALLFPVQWDEPFGLVMVEAMACGTPVVGHALGSVAEVVDQGVTGFHTDSIVGMATLVSRAVELDRSKVFERAKSRFSYQAMVDNYLEFYRTLAR